jgi:hypothetical protein
LREGIVLNKILNFFRPKRLEAEIEEELEFHRSRTSGSFGNMTLIRDQVRDASTILWLETLVQDLRYGIRQLRTAPVLVAVAVLSLALGIGANTAIFTLINAVMLQSLPVRDPGRLVLFYDGIDTGVYSGDDFPGNIFLIRRGNISKHIMTRLKAFAHFGKGPIVLSCISPDLPKAGPLNRRKRILFPETTSRFWA